MRFRSGAGRQLGRASAVTCRNFRRSITIRVRQGAAYIRFRESGLRNHAFVEENPEEWLLWNCQATLAGISGRKGKKPAASKAQPGLTGLGENGAHPGQVGDDGQNPVPKAHCTRGAEVARASGANQAPFPASGGPPRTAGADGGDGRPCPHTAASPLKYLIYYILIIRQLFGVTHS